MASLFPLNEKDYGRTSRHPVNTTQIQGNSE